jgi:hypothetical protein
MNDDRLIEFQTAKLITDNGLIKNCYGDFYLGFAFHEDGSEQNIAANYFTLEGLYPRTTQTKLQSLLRDKYGIIVESNYFANIGKYRCFFKPKSIIPKDFKTVREYRLGVEKYYSRIDFDTYEEALELGLFEGSKLITNEIN